MIVGPPGDPASARTAKSAAAALRAIAARGARFVTRGDRSGTHLAELEPWAEAWRRARAP